MKISEIIELMKAVSENSLTCFELEQGDTKIVMKREKKQVQTGAVPNVPEQKVLLETGMPGEGTAKETSAFGDPQQAPDKVVTCPLVGTFYSSPAPDAEDFVKVGDTVKKGQVIGIVEAMKLMNEIECEYDGVVEAILVKNEDVVEYGQPLLRIR